MYKSKAVFVWMCVYFYFLSFTILQLTTPGTHKDVHARWQSFVGGQRKSFNQCKVNVSPTEGKTARIIIKWKTLDYISTTFSLGFDEAIGECHSPVSACTIHVVSKGENASGGNLTFRKYAKILSALFFPPILRNDWAINRHESVEHRRCFTSKTKNEE